MAYCGACGNPVADEQTFCTSCGAPVNAQGSPAPMQVTQSPAQEPATQAAPAAPQAAPQQGYAPGSGGYQAHPTPNYAPGSPEADVQANKTMGILAYLGILVLIPIFAAKQSPFARYHANQGLVLAIVEVGWWILTAIINTVMTAVLFNSWAYGGSWGLWGLISTLLGLVNILFVVLAIMGIVNAAGGKCKPLPVIGKIEILK